MVDVTTTPTISRRQTENTGDYPTPLSIIRPARKQGRTATESLVSERRPVRMAESRVLVRKGADLSDDMIYAKTRAEVMRRRKLFLAKSWLKGSDAENNLKKAGDRRRTVTRWPLMPR